MEPSRRDRSASLAESYPVTIIIPARNAATFLADTMESLAANDLRNTEVILVDDASRDGTGQIARQFRESIKLHVVSSATQTGPAGARNLGITRASFPYLLFLDADVLLPPKALYWIRETFDLYSHREDIAGVLGSYSEAGPDEDFLTNFKNLSTTYLYKITDTQSPFLHTAIFAVKRPVLELAGGFDPRLDRAEDFLLGIKLGSRGYRFIIDRRIKACHLKTYSLTEILAEDWQRIQNLSRIKLSGAERRFSMEAHRWSRLLSLLMPGMTAACLALGFIEPAALWVALALSVFFLLVNLRFASYLVATRGFWFGVGSVLFLFFEMFWASLAVGVSVVRGRLKSTNALRP